MTATATAFPRSSSLFVVELAHNNDIFIKICALEGFEGKEGVGKVDFRRDDSVYKYCVYIVEVI